MPVIKSIFIKFLLFSLISIVILRGYTRSWAVSIDNGTQWTEEKIDNSLLKGAQDFFRQGLYDKAIEKIEECLSEGSAIDNREKALVYVGLGDIYIEKARINITEGNIFLNKAKSYFQKAAQFLPEDDLLNSSVYSGLGYIYLRQKDYSQAVSHSRKALMYPVSDLPKKQINVYTDLGMGYLNLKQHQEAVTYFNKALELSGANRSLAIQINFALAYCYKTLKDYPRAIECLNNILSTLSPDAQYYKSISGDYFLTLLKYRLTKKLNFSGALSLLRELDNHSTKNEMLLLNNDAWRLLNEYYRLLGGKSDRKILKILERYDLFKNNPALAHLFWGNYYLYKENIPKAKEEFHDILKINPDSLAAYTGLENIYLKEEEPLEALKCFMKVKNILSQQGPLPISLYNNLDKIYYRNLANIYLQVKKKIKLEDLLFYTEAIKGMIPQYQDVIYSALGEIYLDNNNLDKAEESFQIAIKKQPSSDVTHADWPYIGLGRLYLKKGDYERAEKYFKIALERIQDSCLAMFELANIYFKINKLDEAKEFYQKASTIVLANDQEADMQLILPVAYMHLGDIALKKEGKKKAKEYYSLVLQYCNVELKEEALDKLKSLK